MKNGISFIAVLASSVGSLLSFPGAASATSIDTLTNVLGSYNVFVQGDITGQYAVGNTAKPYTSDSIGAIVAGGNVSLSNFAANVGTTAAPYGLIVGGNLTMSAATAFGQNVFVGGTANLTNTDVAGNLTTNALSFTAGTISGNATTGQGMSVTNSSILGNATAGTSLTFGSGTVTGNVTAGQSLLANNSTFSHNATSGGNLTFTSGTINGNATAGQALSLAHATVNGNGTAGGGINLNGSSTIVGTSSPNASVSIPTVPTTVSAPIAIPTTYNTLTAASAILGGLSQSVGANTVTNGASLTLSDSNVGLDVFTLNTSQFSGSLKDFTINAPTGATVVVDINGSGPVSWTSSGFNLSGGITTSKVLLDFTSTQSIVLSGIGILGSVLAPDATITGSDGQFDGTVIAANLVGSMEFDAPGNFNGDLSSVSNISAVPLPAALPMFGFALAGLSGIGLRSRRRA